MPLLYATHPRYLDHDSGPRHPERPERLRAVDTGIAAAGLSDALVRVTPRAATRAELELIHPAAYLDAIERFAGHGGGYLDADTHMGTDSHEAALLAAGAGLDMIERLARGEGEVGFCAVRPPGHHALAGRAMGFCMFNNVAVSAAALAGQGERVVIVDYDAHHGNGTQALFESDPRVLYVSLHEWPAYPGTGAIDEIGRGDGRGSTLNLPFPSRTTGDVYRRAIDDVVVPAVVAFAPSWLIISAGFDAHHRDPLTDLGLTSGDFADITRVLAELVGPGRRLLFLEGGYDLQALADSVGATLSALVDDGSYRPEAASSGGPGESVCDAALNIRARLADQ